MRNLLLIAILVCTILFSCSHSPTEVAGGSTTTPNEKMILGYVNFQGGAPAARTIVQLIPSSYCAFGDGNQLALPTDTTDESGAYSFAHVTTGSYNIQAIHIDTRVRSLITNIIMNTDTSHVSPAILEQAGNLLVIFSDSFNPVSGYVYIPGTTIAKYFDGVQDSLVLDSVPAGIIPGVYYSTVDTSENTVLRNNVPVSSGDTVIVTNPMWKYSRKLFLNTTKEGAAVSENVTNFPVLIRLTHDNFTFNQAQIQGRDLRFENSDNTPLPYEIERWDVSGEKADIWVEVDTVHGDDSTQYITMYWGNPASSNSAHSKMVFDTSEGFRAVLHCDNISDLSDASANLGKGTNYGTVNVPGIIGNALQFVNDKSTYVMFPHKDNVDAASLLESPSGCTFSWWMLSNEDLDTISNNGRRDIISKGVYWGGTTDQDWTVFIRNDVILFEGFSAAENWVYAGTSMISWEADIWYHISITYDGTTAQWFINGEPDGPGIPFDYAFGTSDDKAEISIGRHYNVRPEEVFDGILDEIRIVNTQKSADWVKLCYMNQRVDDKLVVFWKVKNLF